MSIDIMRYKGKLKPVEFDNKKDRELYFENLIDNSASEFMGEKCETYLPEQYESWEEMFFEDFNDEDYFIINGILYENEKYDNQEDSIIKNSDGTIDYDLAIFDCCDFKETLISHGLL